MTGTKVYASIAPSLKNDISRHYATGKKRSLAGEQTCHVASFSSLDSLYENLQECATYVGSTAVKRQYAPEITSLRLHVTQSGRLNCRPAKLSLACSDPGAPEVHASWGFFHSRIYHDEKEPYRGPALEYAVAREIAKCDELEFLRYTVRLEDAALGYVQQAWSIWQENRDTDDEEYTLRMRNKCNVNDDLLKFLLWTKAEGYADHLTMPREIDGLRLREEVRAIAPYVRESLRATRQGFHRFALPYWYCNEDHAGLTKDGLICAHYMGRLMIETMALAAGARNGDMHKMLVRQRTLRDFLASYVSAAKEVGFTEKDLLFPRSVLNRFSAISDELSAGGSAPSGDRMLLILSGMDTPNAPRDHLRPRRFDGQLVPVAR